MSAKTVNAIRKFEPIGSHVNETDLSTVLTVTMPSYADGVIVQCNTKNVRYTVDGATDPTATVGFLLVANADPLLIIGNEIRFIEASASASLQYQFVNTGAGQ